jgi:hypothetical protein
MTANGAIDTKPLLQMVVAAPHRLLFLVGASNILAAMAWWALWPIDLRWRVFGFNPPPVPAGWLHAALRGSWHSFPGCCARSASTPRRA